MTASNLDILAYEDTPLGPLCLRRRTLLSSPGTVVTEITLDHAFLMSSYSTASERALAAVALEMHGGTELRVMIGGLGLGHTAHAALESSRVGRVEVMELLPQVIAWLQRGLLPLSGALLEDPRFVPVAGDVYARLAAPPAQRSDLILIDVDHSPEQRLGKDNAAFYTEAGLTSAREHLAPGGILGVWSYAESSEFSRALRQVFATVRVEPVTSFNELADEETTDWLFFAR
jgi:spermidine synthase